jgi:hypothetical protein
MPQAVEISQWVSPALLAVIVFFLKRLLTQFDEMRTEVRESMLKHAALEQRLIKLESEVSLLFDKVFKD